MPELQPNKTQKIGERAVAERRMILKQKEQGKDLTPQQFDLTMKKIAKRIGAANFDTNNPEVADLVGALSSELEKKLGSETPIIIKKAVDKLKTPKGKEASPKLTFEETAKSAAEAPTESKQAKTKENPEQKAQAERFRQIGELTNNLMNEDQKLAAIASEITPEKVTGPQEKTIESADKIITAKFTELGITPQERLEILKLLPNFVKAKKAILNFHINRDETTAATMMKNYKQGRIQGEVNPMTKKVTPPKRIEHLRSKAQKYKEELNKYNIAA